MNTTARVWALFMAIFAMMSQVEPVAADAGDVIAGLLGTTIALVAICAFLGWWSRRSDAGGVPSSDDV